MNFKDTLKKVSLVVALVGALVAAHTVGRKIVSFDTLPPKIQKEVKDERQVLLDTIMDLRANFATLVPSEMTRKEYLELDKKIQAARILLAVMCESHTSTKLLQELDSFRADLSNALRSTRKY